MSYKFEMQADNVYVIDTKMFGFDNYMSAYLVQGKELALIDTGLPADSGSNTFGYERGHENIEESVDYASQQAFPGPFRYLNRRS